MNPKIISGVFTTILWQYCRYCLRDPAAVVYVKTAEYGFTKVCGTLSHRADPRAARVADRHYNRQKIGAKQFVPPGRCLVLLTEAGDALWVTSWPFAQYVKHDWAGAWVNSCFRREGGDIASKLISEALAASRFYWGEPPAFTCQHCGKTVSLVTFIDTEKTLHKRDPGRCYIKAGFVRCTAKTKGGLVVVHIGVMEMPAGEPARGTNGRLIA